MIIEINKESAKILSRALLMARIDWERDLEHIKIKHHVSTNASMGVLMSYMRDKIKK